MLTGVEKLNERHTKAGIEIQYDDHGVGLYRNGAILKHDGKVAYWQKDVTIKEIIEFADHALDCANIEEHNKAVAHA